MVWSSASLVTGEPYTAEFGNAFVPPTWSMCAWVRIVRRTGGPSSATAKANGSHCDRTIRVSITVMPSSSTTTPAFATPVSPPGSNQAYTPSPSSVRDTSAVMLPGYAARFGAPPGAVYPRRHVGTLPEPPAPHLSRRARLQREDAGQGARSRRRHGVPRPRGLRRAVGERGRARQRGAGHQRPRLGRHRRVRARERVGHEVDLS